MREEILRRIEPIERWLMRDVDDNNSWGLGGSGKPPRIEIICQWIAYPFRLLVGLAKALIDAFVYVGVGSMLFLLLFYPSETVVALQHAEAGGLTQTLTTLISIAITAITAYVILGGRICPPPPPRFWS